MVKTEMIQREVLPKQTTGQLKDFSLTYSYYNDKRQYQETAVRMVGYSLGDVKERLQEVLGGREITILTHNSGDVLHGFTRPAVRRLIKSNIGWYNAENATADRQVKRDTMIANRSAKITTPLDENRRGRHII